MIDAVESERALIATAVFYPQDCAEAFERLKPEHFTLAIHQEIWADLRTGVQSDLSLLISKFKMHPGLADLGGVSYISNFVDSAYVPSIPSHTEAVLDCATRKSIGQLTRYVQTEIAHIGRGEGLLGEIERACADIAREACTAPGAAPVGLSANDNLDAAFRGDFQGSDTGLACLDKVAGGIKQDDVWFIGGRTSMGKSVAGLNIANGIAQQGRGVLMFSLEMPLREVQMRLIADIAHRMDLPPVRYGDLLKGRGDHDTRDRARAAAKRLASLPINVNDRGGLTIDDIRHQGLRQVRAWERAGMEPGAILIDHIGLVEPVKSSGNKAADTSDTVNQLKALAKLFRCPIIALAQINRNTESRNDKRPTIADFNWSGAMEQIADLVCLLYRQGYYDARSLDSGEQRRAIDTENDLELIIAKNRSGPICTVKAWCDVSCNAIRDLPSHEHAMVRR